MQEYILLHNRFNRPDDADAVYCTWLSAVSFVRPAQGGGSSGGRAPRSGAPRCQAAGLQRVAHVVPATAGAAAAGGSCGAAAPRSVAAAAASAGVAALGEGLSAKKGMCPLQPVQCMLGGLSCCQRLLGCHSCYSDNMAQIIWRGHNCQKVFCPTTPLTDL